LKEYKWKGGFDTAEDGLNLDLQIISYDIDILMRIIRFDASHCIELNTILRARKMDTAAVIGAATEA
jgi:hypothetical protein